MNKSSRDWIAKVKEMYPWYFSGMAVVEYGSMNVNGTIRDAFEDCCYNGVDWREGPEVDTVARMHEFSPLMNPAVVVTIGTMEHDRHLWKSLDRCWEILLPDGLFVGTAAGKGFQKHHVEAGEGEYYDGVDTDRFRAWMESKGPREWSVSEENDEIFFYAIKEKQDEQT